MTSNVYTAGIDIDQVVDRVQEDPTLTPEEKETVIRFTKAEDVAHIYTEEGGITRRLLRHPHFDLDEWRVVDDDVWGKRIGSNAYNGETVTGVGGRLPIGSLKVRASKRSTSGHADVVSWGNGRNRKKTP
jgi:hypothetical protein